MSQQNRKPLIIDVLESINSNTQLMIPLHENRKKKGVTPSYAQIITHQHLQSAFPSNRIQLKYSTEHAVRTTYWQQV